MHLSDRIFITSAFCRRLFFFALFCSFFSPVTRNQKSLFFTAYAFFVRLLLLVFSIFSFGFRTCTYVRRWLARDNALTTDWTRCSRSRNRQTDPRQNKNYFYTKKKRHKNTYGR